MPYTGSWTTSYSGRDTLNTPYMGKTLADELSFQYSQYYI